MTDYTKSTNFASKDALASGNPLKIVKGTEIDAEFNNIAEAVATKADINSPALIGNASAVNLTVSGTLTATLTGNVTGNTSGSSGSVATTNWTITESGGKLYFKYGGVNKMSLDSSGNIIVTGNVTGYGTP